MFSLEFSFHREALWQTNGILKIFTEKTYFLFTVLVIIQTANHVERLVNTFPDQ